jgi:hypothetical protein
MIRKASIIIKAALYGILTSLFLTIITVSLMAGFLMVSTSASKIMGVTLGNLFKTVQIIGITSYISSVAFLYVIFSNSVKKK